MALFNFRLRPLEQVDAWRTEGGQRGLHWFGLSDGEFWIDTATSRLLEYSDAAVASRDFPRFVEYPVAAFYDAVIEAIPACFTPVPERLQHHLRVDGLAAFDAAWDRWNPTAQRDDALIDLCIWPFQRRLDLGYLESPPRIFMWTTADAAHLTWLADACAIDGRPMWSATRGEISMPLEQLRAEILDFHERYIAAMGERCAEVKAGARSDVAIDLDALDAELIQHRRLSWPQLFAGEYDAPDWNAIASAMQHVEMAAQ